jgi:hypothetical protein
LHERLIETRREQNLAPGHVERTVRTALRLADKPDLMPASLASARKEPSSGSHRWRARGPGVSKDSNTHTTRKSDR